VTLSYTINRLLENQLAEIERDLATLDPFDGEAKAKPTLIGTIRCSFWWWKEGGARSPAREYATPQRSINFIGGFLMVEKGAEVKERDHVKAITDPNHKILIPGPFRVVAVEEWEDHNECSLMRP
jgi:hypothetical protein